MKIYIQIEHDNITLVDDNVTSFDSALKVISDYQKAYEYEYAAKADARTSDE